MTAWMKASAGVAAFCLLAPLSRPALAADAAHPAVIELFQSQGCSSCPPAEANVRAVSGRPDVLALSFEVDYWDRLGWKDTFSRPAWTARQYAYAKAMGHGDSVYTPQVVVNGRVAGDALEPGALAGLIVAAIAARPARVSAFPAGRSQSGRAGRRPAGRTSGSRAIFPIRSRSRSRAERTPATRCPTRMWCARWSCSANGKAKPPPSPRPAATTQASPRRPSSKRAGEGRSSRRRSGRAEPIAQARHALWPSIQSASAA